MNTSIKDREGWITEKAEEIAEDLYCLGKDIETIAHRWAEQEYDDALADYAESREER